MWEGVSASQALRLAVAYGLREVPTKREPYVPFYRDVIAADRNEVTPERVAYAVELWREGLTMKAIAHECGLTFSQLNGVVKKNRGLFPRRYRKEGA